MSSETTTTTTTTALVSYAPNPQPDWRVETITVCRPPRDHELKIRMVATGVCHTDLFVASVPDGAAGFHYPKVLGHEGAGIVEEVGPGVTVSLLPRSLPEHRLWCPVLGQRLPCMGLPHQC